MPKQAKKAPALKPVEPEIELPLPMAPLVRILKQNIDGKKQVKRRVKIELNLFVAKIIGKIAKRMDQHQYTYIDYSMFEKAIDVYEKLEEVADEKERIIIYLEKIKSDINELEKEVSRKFDVEGNEIEEEDEPPEKQEQ